ncbi:hypothetical protein FACS1894189_7520 [Planctomycetales bacterium]|nr:hypothetical protein FACS1894189_7520 [Planctomycetales bacterium]
MPKAKGYPHIQTIVVLMPPGYQLAEKIDEMGISAQELASRMKVSLKTVKSILTAKKPVTSNLAKKIESATKMSADFMLRCEERYRAAIEFVRTHPEFQVQSFETTTNN